MLQFDGVSWDVLRGGIDYGIADVSGSSPTDLYAVGYQRLLHYDGVEWIRDSYPQVRLEGIWGFSSDDISVVGEDGLILHFDGTVLHFDGTNWVPMADCPDSGWSELWGTSSTDLYIGSSLQGRVVHWDGLDWTELSNAGGENTIEGFWGTSGGVFYALKTLWDVDSEQTVILRGER